jgi:hypothetical protein
MVWIGKVSYSLYLWHWPFITLGKFQANLFGFPQDAGAVVGGLIGILLGFAAYIYVEQPLRSKGTGRSWRFAVIGTGSAIVAICSCVLGFRSPAVNSSFNTTSLYFGHYDAGRNVGLDQERGIALQDIYLPPLPTRSDDAWRTGGIVHLYGGDHPKVVVLGSSHALMYSHLIDDICREKRLSVAFLGVGHGTPAFFEARDDWEARTNPNFSSSLEAEEFDLARRKWLREWHPEIVFVVDRWDARFRTPLNFDSKLRLFLKEISPLADRIVFVTQVPVVKGGDGINLREYITFCKGTMMGVPILYPDDREPIRMQTVAIAEAAKQNFTNLHILRADLPFKEKNGSIRYSSGKTFFYADSDHLSDLGSAEIRELFQNEISRNQSDTP